MENDNDKVCNIKKIRVIQFNLVYIKIWKVKVKT